MTITFASLHEAGASPLNAGGSFGWMPPVHRTASGAGLIRAVDLVLATMLLFLALPVMAMIALAVRVSMGGQVIFAHDRIGCGGRMFPCFKFRSMALDADRRLAHLLATDPVARAEWQRDHKLRDDPRITPLGAFLRRSSLDELPQLFNVLRGEMSLVGPRPIVPEEIHRYGRYLRQYCSVPPGITGLWQVSGRNNTTYRNRVALDICYARNRSLGLNAYILLATVPSVLLARGSY